MKQTWLSALVEKIDLGAIPAAEQKQLRDFMAQFTLSYIPTTVDSPEQKAAKVQFIREKLPIMTGFIK